MASPPFFPLSRIGALPAEGKSWRPPSCSIPKKKALQLFAKENFVNDDNFVLTVRGRRVRKAAPSGRNQCLPPRPPPATPQVAGTLDTADGAVVGKAALRKKFFPGVRSLFLYPSVSFG